MKKIAVLLLVIFAFFRFSAPVRAESKSFYFPAVSLNITVNRDKSVDFTERRATDFRGSFTQIYWDIPLRANQLISGVTFREDSPAGSIFYEQIPALDSSRPLHKFAVIRTGNSLHIEAYHSSLNITKTFRLSYHLTNAVQKYRDVGEFYWKAIGDGWGAKTDKVTVTVKLPQDVGRENIYIWGHGPQGGRAEIIDGQTAVFAVSDVPPKTFVEIRELFPADILTGPAVAEDRLPQVKAEEQQIQQQTRLTGLLKLSILGFSVLFLFGWIIFWIYIWKKHGQEYRLEDIPRYVHFPPSKTPPALVEALLSQEETVTPNSFSATLLDLARRKVLKIEARESSKKGILGIGGGRKYDYILRLQDGNYGVNNSLADYEKELISFIFVSEDRQMRAVPLEILKAQMEKDWSTTRAFFENWSKLVKKEADRKDFVEEESKKWQKIFLLSTILLFLFAVIILVLYQRQFLDNLFLLIFVLLTIFPVTMMPASRLMLRWTKPAEAEAKQWQGFKHFLVDFSHFKDELPRALTIWEEMLVYGTALGVAKKVAEYLPLILNQPGAAYPVWFYATDVQGNVFAADSVSGIGLDFGTSLAQSFSGMTSALNSSFSSGGGGGFSGGGGGGDGGGGGGAS